MDSQLKENTQKSIDNVEIHATWLPDEYWQYIFEECVLHRVPVEEMAKILGCKICIVKHIIKMCKKERDKLHGN